MQTGEYLKSFSMHPEYAYNGPDGLPCNTKTRGLLSRRVIFPSIFIYQGKEMMYGDDIHGILSDHEEEIVIYGKSSNKRVLPLVLKIMPDIPRDSLSEFIPHKSYKAFYTWQTGKRAPQNIEELLEATVAWTRQYVPNSQDLSMQELFRAYLTYKKELSRRVRRMVRKIPDSVLHHKMSLNSRTISRLRKGEELQIVTLIRLDSFLSQGEG